MDDLIEHNVRDVQASLRDDMWKKISTKILVKAKNQICKQLGDLFVQKVRQSLSDQIYYAYLFPYKAN